MLNRGSYRKWIFEDDGAKMSFEKALFETWERAGWVLHAYCVMDNHFHLALETPEPNLSEGMRLLQSVFSIRFNKCHSHPQCAIDRRSGMAAYAWRVCS